MSERAAKPKVWHGRLMSNEAPRQSIPSDWHPVYGWKPMATGMDSGVIDIGREHALHWYSSSVYLLDVLAIHPY
jgi:hypothetical protein